MTDSEEQFVAQEIRAGKCPFGNLRSGQTFVHCPLGFPGCGCADEFMLNPYLKDLSPSGEPTVHGAGQAGHEPEQDVNQHQDSNDRQDDSDHGSEGLRHGDRVSDPPDQPKNEPDND